MGFQTTVLVKNDCLDAIRDDKEFGKKVHDAVIQGWGHLPVTISSGHCCNAAAVIESHHTDGRVVLVAGGNLITRIGYVGTYPTDPQSLRDLKTLLNNVLSWYGLKVVKAPKKK